MFNGRHCKVKDLNLLDKETEIVLSLLKEDREIDLSHYFEIIEMFDPMIKEEIATSVKEKNNKEISSIISNKIKELRRNVIIDIQEH